MSNADEKDKCAQPVLNAAPIPEITSCHRCLKHMGREAPKFFWAGDPHYYCSEMCRDRVYEKAAQS